MSSVAIEAGAECGNCPDTIEEGQSPVAFNCNDPECSDLHAFHKDCLTPGLLAALDQQQAEESRG